MSQLQSLVQELWAQIPPSGTLQDWLPEHPLPSQQGQTFEEAVTQVYADFLQGSSCPELATLNRLSMKWLSVYFDSQQSSLPLPGRNNSLLRSILEVHRFESPKRSLIEKALTKPPMRVLEESLSDIPQDRHQSYLSMLLSTLPGWARYIRYQAKKANQPQEWELEYLALRALWASVLQLPELEKPELPKGLKKALKQLESREQQQKQSLQETLSHAWQKRLKSQEPTVAHWVFCIDVRSEPMRGILESLGPYSSDGMAGFLGLDVALYQPESQASFPLCPAILQPGHHIEAEKIPPTFSEKVLSQLSRIDKHIKAQLMSSLLWVECLGVLFGLATLLLSFGWVSSKRPEAPAQSGWRLGPNASWKLPLELKISAAWQLISGLSCSSHLPPYIILCGHGASVLNNIFAAKLQCGACGNYRGLDNARLMAQICQEADVRAALSERYGVNLGGSIFIAAEHDTVSDCIEFFDVPLCAQNDPLWKQTEKDAARAGSMRFRQRQRELSGQTYHWAQARPEWGLAGHQTLIIGPASWALAADLKGRAFLHSYEPDQDSSGTQLRTIFQGPVAVGFLLNMQYFLPSFDPQLFAAGNKMQHQLSLGEMAICGNGSDLLIGLPEQAVLSQQGRRYHQPSRLLLIIAAPQARVLALLAQEHHLRQQLDGRWLNLLLFDAEEESWLSWEQLRAALEQSPQSLRETASVS